MKKLVLLILLSAFIFSGCSDFKTVETKVTGKVVNTYKVEGHTSSGIGLNPATGGITVAGGYDLSSGQYGASVPIDSDTPDQYMVEIEIDGTKYSIDNKGLFEKLKEGETDTFVKTDSYFQDTLIFSTIGPSP